MMNVDTAVAVLDVFKKGVVDPTLEAEGHSDEIPPRRRKRKPRSWRDENIPGDQPTAQNVEAVQEYDGDAVDAIGQGNGTYMVASLSLEDAAKVLSGKAASWEQQTPRSTAEHMAEEREKMDLDAEYRMQVLSPGNPATGPIDRQYDDDEVEWNDHGHLPRRAKLRSHDRAHQGGESQRQADYVTANKPEPVTGPPKVPGEQQPTSGTKPAVAPPKPMAPTVNRTHLRNVRPLDQRRITQPGHLNQKAAGALGAVFMEAVMKKLGPELRVVEAQSRLFKKLAAGPDPNRPYDATFPDSQVYRFKYAGAIPPNLHAHPSPDPGHPWVLHAHQGGHADLEHPAAPPDALLNHLSQHPIRSRAIGPPREDFGLYSGLPVVYSGQPGIATSSGLKSAQQGATTPRMVYGVITGPHAYDHGPVYDPNWLRHALRGWLKFGNIHVEHRPAKWMDLDTSDLTKLAEAWRNPLQTGEGYEPVGRAVDLDEDDVGDIVLAARIDDDKTWDEIVDGRYRGFSLYRVDGDPRDLDRNVVSSGRFLEVSLTERPAYIRSSLSTEPTAVGFPVRVILGVS